MSVVNKVKKDLQSLANPKQAKLLQGFFKTGPGQYGEEDIFLGIKVPVQRSVAKKHKDLSLKDIQELLNSKIHEHRLVALFILMDKYKKSDNKGKKQIFDTYLKNTKNINNWDLIDLSAPNIVGNYLLDKKREILYKLAHSKSLWEKRISILATFEFIANKETKDTLAIAEILLHDKHDLIHKAVGWMLRELGKRVSQTEEEKFLKKYYKVMPRTMLRYAIERFSDEKKKFYMKK
ncbi:DNA alkylation repair protein [Euryarchaeota archaeon SM23-78]|nr:MAG: DNA alkylation repair protein [Euryarchaeota archaeon SM23-78]MBW3000462.1 DNA alkylation repair protein [Candidatus Woesearchaeota archaeon]